MNMNDYEKRNGDKEFVSAQVLFPIIKELLAEGKQASFTVTGMSMWPFLCHGRDRVVLDACLPETLMLGDILLFRTAQGNYMLHRVTALRSSQFQTTGDGNYFRDGWFPNSCILGRAVQLIRKGKNIDCCNQKYKVICRIWMLMFPIRKWIFAVWFRIRKYIRR